MLKKIKILFFTTMALLSSKAAMACPACVGAVQGSEDDYTVYALMAFVAFTYVPGYFIYRLIKKSKKIEKSLEAAQRSSHLKAD